MARSLLSSNAVSPEAVTAMDKFHPEVLKTVSDAVNSEAVVIVGMKQNPHVKRACHSLAKAGIEFKYLEYGSYLGQWKERLAIKLWSGWPTFPQVFVKGVLIGGASDLAKALEDGSFQKRLGGAKGKTSEKAKSKA